MITISIILGYSLGSIPSAVWISGLYGIDIFKIGSGNPGATNVRRSVSKIAGTLVFLCDFAKGTISTGWPLKLFGCNDIELCIFGLLGSILGHCFSMFIHFKGGKGVSPMLGGMIVLIPISIIIGILVWLIIFYTTRYVSLASMSLGLSLPVSVYFFDGFNVLYILSVVSAVLVLARHSSNINRLILGTEISFR